MAAPIRAREATRRLRQVRRVAFPAGGALEVIFEASNVDVYYVCTPWNGVLGGEPFPMGLGQWGRAIDFDEVVEGNA